MEAASSKRAIPPYYQKKTRNSNERKCKRGKRNGAKRIERYIEWRNMRKLHRQLQRQLNHEGSEALRKVTAASSPGVAIQDANLLYNNSALQSRARSPAVRNQANTSKKGIPMRILCSKNHRIVIEEWKFHRAKVERRKNERRIRIESLRRRRSPAHIAFNTPKTQQNAADLTHSLPYGQTFTTWLCLAELFFWDFSWSFLLCFFSSRVLLLHLFSCLVCSRNSTSYLYPTFNILSK